MRSYQQLRLSYSLLLGWQAGWVVALGLAVQTLVQAMNPMPVPSRAQGIEWPVHDGGPCLGDVLSCWMPPVVPEPFERAGQELPYLPLPALETARAWRTIIFTGTSIGDFLSLQATATELRALVANASHVSGVRVRFGPQVSYSCFFEVLYLSQAAGECKYWLDVRHTPATLYFVTFPKQAEPPTH